MGFKPEPNTKKTTDTTRIEQNTKTEYKTEYERNTLINERLQQKRDQESLFERIYRDGNGNGNGNVDVD
jgi:hypothetical protein